MGSAARQTPFVSDAEAIAWCARLRRSSLVRRRAAFAELARVFQSAPAPETVNGSTDIGMVAAPLGLPADALARCSFNTGFWLHKKFDAAERRGINGFARWFRFLAPAAFPGGRFHLAGGRLWGVRFANERTQSLVFPGKEVFTVDYRSPETALPMRTTVDEAVQISPNVLLCLGLAVVRGRAVSLLWFTLAGGEVRADRSV